MGLLGSAWRADIAGPLTDGLDGLSSATTVNATLDR